MDTRIDALPLFAILFGLVLALGVTTLMPLTVDAKYTTTTEVHKSVADKLKLLEESCNLRGGWFEYSYWEATDGEQMGHASCTDTTYGNEFDCQVNDTTTICDIGIQAPGDMDGPLVEPIDGIDSIAVDDTETSPFDDVRGDNPSQELHDGEPTPTPVPQFKG